MKYQVSFRSKTCYLHIKLKQSPFLRLHNKWCLLQRKTKPPPQTFLGVCRAFLPRRKKQGKPNVPKGQWVGKTRNIFGGPV